MRTLPAHAEDRWNEPSPRHMHSRGIRRRGDNRQCSQSRRSVFFGSILIPHRGPLGEPARPVDRSVDADQAGLVLRATKKAVYIFCTRIETKQDAVSAISSATPCKIEETSP